MSMAKAIKYKLFIINSLSIKAKALMLRLCVNNILKHPIGKCPKDKTNLSKLENKFIYQKRAE